MLNFKKLVDPAYLFTINSVMFSRSDKVFFAIGIILTVLGIFLKVSAYLAPNPVDKVVREKFYRLFISIGISEVIWFGCRYQNVRFFGSHFVALLVLLVGLVWGIWLIVSLFKNYRAKKSDWEKEQIKLKYLSGKK